MVARILGRDEYGTLGIIQNTIGLFGTLAGFGMGLTANKHVAEYKKTDPERAGRIIGTSSIIAWISSGAMALALFVAAKPISSNLLAAPELGTTLQIGALMLLFNGINGAQTGTLSGFESFKTIAHVNLVSGLCAFPLTLIGAWFWGLNGVVGSMILVSLLNCALCYRAIKIESGRNKVSVSFASTAADRKLFLSFSLPAVLTGILNGFVSWMAGALLVNQEGGYADMGTYSAALRVKMFPEMFLGMLIAPMLPILSDSFGQGDKTTFERTLRFNFTLALLIIVPISLIQTAAPALTLLPFGSDYQGGTVTIQLLMLHAVIYALIFPMGSILISMGQMWFSWLVNLIYAVLFGLAAWWLVPRHGSAGYAAAMVTAYFVANIPCVIFMFRNIPNVMQVLSWSRIVLASTLIFIGCLFAARELPFQWAIAAGCCSALTFLAVIHFSQTTSNEGRRAR